MGGQFRARGAQGASGRAEHGYHAYLWLSYAYLQQGRVDDARRVVDHMGTLLAQARARGVAYHYAAARAAWVIDSERWDDLPKATDAMALAPPGGRAASLFADGFAATRRGDVAAAEQALQALEAVKQAASSTETHHGMRLVSPAEMEGVAVTAVQLAGVIAHRQGREGPRAGPAAAGRRGGRQDAV